MNIAELSHFLLTALKDKIERMAIIFHVEISR